MFKANNPVRRAVSLAIPLLAAASIAPAHADGGAKRVADMSGFYAGVHLGYGGGQDRVEEINGPRIYYADTDGVIAGAQIGWQKQFDDIVAGFEIEGGLLGQSADKSHADGFVTVATTVDFDAHATFSGRVGVVLKEDWLVYGRAGITVAELNAATSESATPSVAETQDSTWGYTFGVGVERRLSDKWSVRAEYQYTDFRNELALPGGGAGPGWDHNIDLHALKVGINMHF